MQLYTIFFEPTKEQDLLQLFPELDQENANYEQPTPQFPDGYNWVEQELTPEQFVLLDNAANNHVCIDIKPSPYPPGNPLGRYY